MMRDLSNINTFDNTYTRHIKSTIMKLSTIGTLHYYLGFVRLNMKIFYKANQLTLFLEKDLLHLK